MIVVGDSARRWASPRWRLFDVLRAADLLAQGYRFATTAGIAVLCRSPLRLDWVNVVRRLRAWQPVDAEPQSFGSST